jgi:hypothetical protein
MRRNQWQRVGRMNCLDAEADQLLGSVAQHLAHGPVRQGKFPGFEVGNEDAVSGGFEDGPQSQFGFGKVPPRLYALGDVLAGAGDADRFAIFVTGDFAPRMDIPLLLVRPQDAKFDVERLVSRQAGIDCIPHAPPVVRMNKFDETLQSWQELAGTDTEDPIVFLGPDECVVDEVMIPPADVGEALGCLQQLVRRAPRRLGALALADVAQDAEGVPFRADLERVQRQLDRYLDAVLAQGR